MGEQLGALAHEVVTPAQQIARGAHLGWVDVGLGERAAAQNGGNLVGIDLIVLCFTPVDRLHVERMPEHEGNALARLGNYQEAIKAYDEALKLQPDHDDAKFNRDLLKQQLQKQPQQDQGKGDESQQDSQADSQQQQQGQGQKSDTQAAEQQQNQTGDQQQDEKAAGEQQNQQGEQAQAQQRAEQKDEQAKGEQQPLGQEQDGEKKDAEKEQAMPTRDYSQTSETDLATEQWLRRIPDDPGGLLRRKFQYQYQQQTQRQKNTETEPW